MKNFRTALIVVFAVVTLPTIALAQASPAASNAAEIPVRAANATPTVGEEALDQNGVVSSAFFVESRICTMRGCRSFIFDKRSGALIKNDRMWSPAYAPTGRGRQVIRVETFTEAEHPLSKPPSDAALDKAPAISKVKRPALKQKP